MFNMTQYLHSAFLTSQNNTQEQRDKQGFTYILIVTQKRLLTIGVAK